MPRSITAKRAPADRAAFRSDKRSEENCEERREPPQPLADLRSLRGAVSLTRVPPVVSSPLVTRSRTVLLFLLTASLGLTSCKARQERLPAEPRLGANVPARITLRIGDASGLHNPRGIAVDGAGNIYIADTGNCRVVKFDSAGKQLLVVGQRGAGPGEFLQPWMLAIADDGDIVVLDREAGWISWFGADGRFLHRIGGSRLALYYPGGLAVTGRNTIAVVDTGGNRVLLLNADGTVYRLITSAGKEPLIQPTDVAADSHHNLYLYQPAGANSPSAVFRLAPGGEMQGKWIAPGAPSTAETPRSTLGPDGRLYMTDPAHARVLVHNAGVETYDVLEPQAPDLHSFRLLTAIAIDSQGRLFLADAGANMAYRLQMIR
jgi:DNA-binding beta-propeller fold protein YncE